MSYRDQTQTDQCTVFCSQFLFDRTLIVANIKQIVGKKGGKGGGGICNIQGVILLNPKMKVMTFALYFTFIWTSSFLQSQLVVSLPFHNILYVMA